MFVSLRPHVAHALAEALRRRSTWKLLWLRLRYRPSISEETLAVREYLAR